MSPAAGTFGGLVELVATLEVDPDGSSECFPGGQSIDFRLNGIDAGSATTDVLGVATHTASLAGIDAGSYPAGVHASFKDDRPFCQGSEDSAELVVSQAPQVIAFTGAPPTAEFNETFVVDAVGGGSSSPVVLLASGVCSILGNAVTMTSGTGLCTLTASQAGDENYLAAEDVTQTTTATRADQVLAWSDPTDISLGTPLGPEQLNAILTIGDGTLTYDPPAGTQLPLGTHPLQVTAAETTNFNRASAEVSVTVVPRVKITTLSLPDGVLGSLYLHVLEAEGGVPPYEWMLADGVLPLGLTLSPSTGAIQGTPLSTGTFPFTVEVNDSGAIPSTADRAFEITVTSPPLDPLGISVTGVPAIVNPASQFDIGLTLNQPPSTPVFGTLTLEFAPDTVTGGDDPMLRFSDGSRAVQFQFPANSTMATLMPQVFLLTGTVSGTIRLMVSADGGPSNIVAGTATLPRLPPQIHNVAAERVGGGLEIGITAYSTERRVTSVGFTFDVRVGSGLEQFSLSRSVEEEFDAWYRSAASEPFGSMFLFVQSFTVQGDSDGVESVTIRLTNGAGTAASEPIVLSSP